MAYDPKNLSALTYANGFTLWHYKTPDASAVVDTTGYFNSASNMLRAGDFILTNASSTGVVENGILIVRQNTPGAVDVSNMSSFGTINSD